MEAVEILAVIFSVIVLVKMLFLFIAPGKWMGFARRILKNNTIVMAVYVILAVVVGYFVISAIDIISVAAVGLLFALIVGISFIPHMDKMIELGETMLQEGFRKKYWLLLVVWTVFAVLVLYKVFLG